MEEILKQNLAAHGITPEALGISWEQIIMIAKIVCKLADVVCPIIEVM